MPAKSNKKRDSGAVGVAQQPPSTKKGRKDPLAELGNIEDKPHVQAIMNLYEEEVSNPNHQLFDILEKHHSTDDQKVEFSKWIDRTFPSDAAPEAYIKDFTVGAKIARSWMLSWDPLSGNSGVVSHDQMLKLIGLVTMNGFQSNADEHIGIDKLVFQERNEKLNTTGRTFPQVAANYSRKHTK